MNATTQSRDRRLSAVMREGERVTPLELFFDLVFVLALTQCTALMAHPPTWGHLQYIDHGNGLNVHWTAITAYLFEHQHDPDPQTGQPRGARLICGTARTNLFGDVDFFVIADDNGEPGGDDLFVIRLGKDGVCQYTTEGDLDHTLGGSDPGGGNIQLHKPNASTTGAFEGSCPARAAVGCPAS